MSPRAPAPSTARNLLPPLPITAACPSPIPSPSPSEVYAALWLGALLAAAGTLVDSFPPALADLARAYFERYPPEVKA